eukprot:8397985-Pyramimonas_sp.AAC.1
MVQDLLDSLQRRYRTYWKLHRVGTGPTGKFIEMAHRRLGTLTAMGQHRTDSGLYRDGTGPTGSSIVMVHNRQGTL